LKRPQLLAQRELGAQERQLLAEFETEWRMLNSSGEFS
jgi:hypothetical protein